MIEQRMPAHQLSSRDLRREFEIKVPSAVNVGPPSSSSSSSSSSSNVTLREPRTSTWTFFHTDPEL